jgi:hypothetical protein
MQTKSIITVQCFTCTRAKIKCLIRRKQRIDDAAHVERLAIDFHIHREGSSTKEKSRKPVIDRYSGFLFDFYSNFRGD